MLGTFASQALLILNTIARSSSAILLMPVLIALLGEAHYSLWITISTVVMYLSLSDAGLGQTVVNKIGEAYARDDFQRVGQVQTTAHVLYWLMVTPVALLALGAIFLLPVDRWLLAEGDLQHGPLLLLCLALAVVLALVRIPFLVFPGMLIGIRRMPMRLLLEFGTTIAVAIAAVVVTWLGGGLLGVVIATNLLLLVATIAAYLPATRGRPWARFRWEAFEPSQLGPLARNSFFFFLISGAQVIDRGALCLIATRMDSLALAPPLFLLLNIFRVAGWSLIGAISMAARPYLLMWQTEGRHETVQQVTQLGAKVTISCAVMFALAIAPFAKPLTSLWIGRECFTSLSPVLLIVATFLVDALFLASTNTLVALNRHRAVSLLLVGKSAAAVVGAILMANTMSDSLTGLTLGMLLGTLAGNAVAPWVYAKNLNITATEYLSRLLVRPLLFVGITLLAIAWLASLTSTLLGLTATAIVLVVAAAIAWLWLFTANERKLCGVAAQKMTLRLPMLSHLLPRRLIAPHTT